VSCSTRNWVSLTALWTHKRFDPTQPVRKRWPDDLWPGSSSLPCTRRRRFGIKSGGTISAFPFHVFSISVPLPLILSSSINLSRKSAKCCNSLVVPQLWQLVKSVGTTLQKVGYAYHSIPNNDAYACTHFCLAFFDMICGRCLLHHSTILTLKLSHAYSLISVHWLCIVCYIGSKLKLNLHFVVLAMMTFSELCESSAIIILCPCNFYLYWAKLSRFDVICTIFELFMCLYV